VWRWEGGGFVVLKYGPQGGLRWVRKSPGGFCDQAEQATGVAVRGDLVVVVGHAYGCCSMALDDGWIRAFRSDGRLRWIRDFEAPGITGTNDRALGVAVSGLSRIYVVGNVEMSPRDDGTVIVDHEAVLQKLSSSGGVIWTRVVHDEGVKDFDRFSAISVRGERVMVTGGLEGWAPYTDEPDYGPRAWLGRYSFGGDLLWSRSWGSDWRVADPSGVSVAPSGATVVADTTQYRYKGSDIGLRVYGATGVLRWSRWLRGPERELQASDVAVAQGGMYVSGWASPASLGARLWRWNATV